MAISTVAITTFTFLESCSADEVLSCFDVLPRSEVVTSDYFWHDEIKIREITIDKINKNLYVNCCMLAPYTFKKFKTTKSSKIFYSNINCLNRI